jgi:hypothetical protein
MNPLKQLSLRLHYDLALKIILCLTTLWAAYLYKTNLSMQLALLSLCVANAFLLHLLYRQTQQFGLTTRNNRQNPSAMGQYLDTIICPMLLNVASTNWLVLLNFYLIYGFYHPQRIAATTQVEYLILAILAILSVALSCLSGYENTLRVYTQLRHECKKAGCQFHPTTRYTSLFIRRLSYLVVALMALILAIYIR